MNDPKTVIKTWPAFTAVGVKRRASGPDGLKGIWMEEFLPRVSEIPHLLESDEAYGLLRNFEEGEGESMYFDYLAAMPVTQVGDLPDGMEAWAVPEGQYAAVTVPFREITKGFELNQQWLADSDYAFDDALPEIEYYPPDFDPGNPDASVQVLTPIKAK